METLYNRGDRVYNHKIADFITIANITLTPQQAIRYGYTTEKGGTGVAAACDLGDAPKKTSVELGIKLLINSCTNAEIQEAFPGLPGGKGVMARKILAERNESPFDGEVNFIDRMNSITTKVDWGELSHRLDYTKPEQIGA